jgi:hypothetical protein
MLAKNNDGINCGRSTNNIAINNADKEWIGNKNDLST